MTEHVDEHGVLPARTASLRKLGARYSFQLGVACVAIGAAAFLFARLTAWPPHEDETLALFVGRDSLSGVVGHVTHDRGGAPLHFLVAWAVAHLGFGLVGLRIVSAVLAVAGLVATAALGSRLADRRTGLVAAALAAATWVFLFQGVFGRMYSLLLVLATLASLALLRALDRGRQRDWVLWAVAILATVATHPYGVLVFGGQAVFVLAARRDRLRAAATAFAAVAVLGIPFWLTDVVLAGRFDVGVGGGGAQLGTPHMIGLYLWWTAGDMSAGWRWTLLPILGLAAIGATAVRRETLAFAGAMVGVPVVAFAGAHLGSSTSPQTRHLIFLLPFFSLLLAAGVLRLGGRVPVIATVAVIALLTLEGAWTWHRTPDLVRGESPARQTARADAAEWLAATGRPDDVLFGYEPIYLAAWERNRRLSNTVVPRADPTLALRALRRTESLGRAVFVFDGSDRKNRTRWRTIPIRTPEPAGAFDVRRFGPFLVVRTRARTETPGGFLVRAGQVQRLGRELGLDDAGVNLDTVVRAQRKLAATS